MLLKRIRKKPLFYLAKLILVTAAYLLLDHFFYFDGHLKDIVSFLILLIPNHFVGIMGWRYIGRHIRIKKPVYWSIYWTIALSFIPGKIIEEIFSRCIASDALIFLDAYWFTARDYLFPLLIVLLLLGWLDKKIKMLPVKLKNFALNTPYIGITLLILIVSYFAYGTWNALQLVDTHYEIRINKESGTMNKLRAVMVSDLHLGRVYGSKRLQNLVKRVNDYHPDIVFITGDIFDDDNSFFIKENMASTLREIQAKLGVYAVLGNHDTASGNKKKNLSYIKESGIKVLIDESFKVADNFYIVGRSDRGEMGELSSGRVELPVLLKDIDKSLPIILLDHQPVDFPEAAKDGVDLQLSGHTHAAQDLLNKPLMSLGYEKIYGLYAKNDFRAIISSGAGTWGSPIRTGSKSEIVELDIDFK